MGLIGEIGFVLNADPRAVGCNVGCLRRDSLECGFRPRIWRR